ncbi:MAG: hypothetical protein AB7O43_19375 [Hyphomicrobiaceae bacterium]
MMKQQSRPARKLMLLPCGGVSRLQDRVTGLEKAKRWRVKVCKSKTSAG